MASIAEQFSQAPVLVSLSLASLVASVLMFGGTLALLPTGLSDSTEPFWLAIVVVGVAITVIWNVLYPLYENFLA
ncbi:hypothetical protein [Haloarchaeobius sp. HME9146]|uniref:hypothetical protein n=1 Tax=Haloarchaeobius sp. HME9146 TaxID=2978732 RepID=UPI0021BE646E|nr:hypothetical protein [Haloarchaeobius sp. HME9146]MCT9094701.1 hypothetical protein [Haloarchaeobius sp. HME9146]